jgi:hypothetical protein
VEHRDGGDCDSLECIASEVRGAPVKCAD